jgi:hypothetical protein
VLNAIFHNAAEVVHDPIWPDGTVFLLRPTGLFREGEDDTEPVARLHNLMWWIGDVPFPSGEIRANVFVSVPDGPALGPFARLRLVADYLFADQKMLARMKDGKWYLNGEVCDFIRCSESV